MVRHTLKILQQVLQDFSSVSDHFTKLRSKGLSTDLFTSLTWETIKVTFLIRKFISITTFTLINSFTWFFYKILITLLVSKSPSWQDGSLRKKDQWMLPLFSFFHVSYFWLTAYILRSRRWQRCPASYAVWQYFQNNIYVSGPIFVKLAYDFKPSCLSPTFVKEKVFSIEHMRLKRALHHKLV